MENNYYIDEMKKILLNKEEKAKEFAEGNNDLESALLSLWDKGYCTTSCCAGHKTIETENYIYKNDPSIYIYYENDIEKELYLLSSLDKNNILSIDIFSNTNNIGFVGIKENTSLFFNDFTKDFKQCDENYKLLMEFALNNDVTININYMNGDIDKITITTADEYVANILKNYAECNEYEYDNKQYYYFNFKDFEFLKSISHSNNK